MSHELTDDDIMAKHRDVVSDFRRFCIEHGTSPVFEETDFDDLSVGFFIAKGVTGDGGSGEAFYEAHTLARVCRYRLHYWEGQSL